jgi:hypothetical protein
LSYGLFLKVDDSTALFVAHLVQLPFGQPQVTGKLVLLPSFLGAHVLPPDLFPLHVRPGTMRYRGRFVSDNNLLYFFFLVFRVVVPVVPWGIRGRQWFFCVIHWQVNRVGLSR